MNARVKFGLKSFVNPRLQETLDKVADICLDQSQTSVCKLCDCFLDVNVKHQMTDSYASRVLLRFKKNGILELFKET